VGGGISRNAWLARIARDGTAVIHTSDSIWAFELGHRGRDRRAPGRAGGQVPARPLPEPAELPPASRPLEPTPDQAAAAASIAASIDDRELRESVQKALSLALARTLTTTRSDTLHEARES
jgi:hypothetical protein